MNPKFYSLPQEKQQAIMNAAFRVFGHNSYKKSPVSEIAMEAGISKSLLFHYFHNKKELYLFLWDKIVQLGREYSAENDELLATTKDLFEVMRRSLKLKCRFMTLYPDMTAFVLKAYYEKDEEIETEIKQSYTEVLKENTNFYISNLNPDDFIPGLDLNLVYQEMYWASEGCMQCAMQSGNIDADKLERDFNRLIELWQSVYSRKKE